MNLNEYEVNNRTIDSSKTWIDVKRHVLLSRELHGHWYNILKKLNSITRDYDYFILICKSKPDVQIINTHSCDYDSFGRLTIKLSNADWNSLGFNFYTVNTQISVKLVDSDDTSLLYKFEN